MPELCITTAQVADLLFANAASAGIHPVDAGFRCWYRARIRRYEYAIGYLRPFLLYVLEEFLV